MHPAFDFIRPLLDRANCVDHVDVIASLNALARERSIELAFIAAPEQKLSAVDYETRIVRDHELMVNVGLHDLFNACIWLTFPKTKRIISELHVALGSGENNRRPRRRDVLTLFDESGLLLLCDPTRCEAFETLNAAHQWKTLFIDERKAFIENVRPILFGHGAMEQLATQFHRGLTAKAVWLSIPHTASLNEADALVARYIAEDALLRDHERRIPLPILGIPGWFAENEAAACYGDVSIFRAARKRSDA